MIWGSAFAVQAIGAQYMGPFFYLSSRSWLAAAFLTPVIWLREKAAAGRGKRPSRPSTAEEKKRLWLAGLVCGSALFVASAAQQIGLAGTTTAKAGFITALYVILVPLAGLLMRRAPAPQLWFCVGVAILGLYLLCLSGPLGLAAGDLWVLACAFLFAVQILCIDRFGKQVDGVRLCRLQSLVVAVESTVAALALEPADFAIPWPALVSVLYVGILSSGVAYTLQIVGMQGVDPNLGSIAMSLESVFSALAGWVLLGQALSGRELLGCALMFGAIILAQVNLPLGRLKRQEAA